MSEEKTYSGGCFCGAVEFAVSGAPVVMGYCHCESCRHWSAGPVTAFSLWAPEALQFTKGEDNILSYNKTDNSFRKSCKTCGGHLYTDHKPMGLVDIYPAVITDIVFEPTMHVFYGESVLSIKDGLPKFKDLPEQAGGSGEMLSE
ncbi:MAG: GFA family protein [Thermodesulfobacteriota bacterium]